MENSRDTTKVVNYFEISKKIKEIARASGVKIVEDPPLARTLYNSVEVDEEIPETLYKALAQILMTLDKFRRR